MFTFNNIQPTFSPSTSSNDLSSPPYLNFITDDASEIQFSPSIKNETSSGEESENEDKVEGEQMLDKQTQVQGDDELESKLEPNMNQIKLNSDVSSNSSCSPIPDITFERKNECKTFQVQQSIEAINRTEACVFYVLSQLSHGEKSASTAHSQ
jgi:hypothetical protein